MGRIRSIKPEFPQSETIGRLSRDARLLFLQLWTVCDDYGRCRAAAPLLAGQLYPYDEDALQNMPAWLAELEREGLVQLYVIDRSSYLAVLGWSKHQRVDNAGKAMVPAPEDARRDSPRTAASRRGSQVQQSRSEESERCHETLDDGQSGHVDAVETTETGAETVQDGGLDTQTNDLRDSSPRIAANRRGSRLDLDQDQEGSSTAHGAVRGKPREPSPPSVPRPDDVPEAVWRDWLALRSGKRARVTATAVDGMRREAAKAGLTLAQALEVAVTQGWQGFRADWLAKRGKPDGQSHSPQQDRHRSEFDLGDPRCQCLSCRAVRRDRGGAT